MRDTGALVETTAVMKMSEKDLAEKEDLMQRRRHSKKRMHTVSLRRFIEPFGRFGFSSERDGSDLATERVFGRFGSKGSDVGSTSSDRAGAGNMVSADATASAIEDLMIQQAEEWCVKDDNQPKNVQFKVDGNW
uniref:AGC-kinase C-terminal domain-containing protein n=1 Tax=Ascaris lumbricoides TaxID=6252 RepID=A0A0M3HH33_ASCLU